MAPRRLRSDVLLAAVAVAALAAATMRTDATRTATVVEPARIAVVDLERTITSSREYECLIEAIDQRGATLDREAAAMRQEVEDRQAELELLTPGTDAHEQASREALRLVHRYRGFIEYAGTALRQQRSEALATIYARVRESANDLVTRDGLDVIFVDDTVVPLPATANEEEMMRQISARRMLAVRRNAIDVTDQLVAE